MSRLRLAAVFLTVCATTGCQAPITYADGRSAANLPANRNALIFEGVTESTMTGDGSVPSSSEDQSRYNDIVRDQIVSKLKSDGFSLVKTRDECGACMRVKGLVYLLPYNPITGGHINIFVKTYDEKDAELFTAFFGRDFGLISLAANGGAEGVVRSSAERAAERLIGELKSDR